ncbi:glycoside hydrolase family 13 protein [Nesterenkonia sp. HG001]|uniref:glycoside hydrolase family 13 protein n=1 Tax=Nesterenkonia sp. HG001 TaxID=2983207 RepID=UPI002AC54044|nr:glycoside hydrolase family 13 protein [Nesterenkonia sp. HG001]MDZ5078458.1 glycoside hydrolase family 13 protein [Nesterenkonia sp. HG001]
MHTSHEARHTPQALAAPEWWRTAVIYQIYPRSFADASGDGVGDLRGITGRLDALDELGVDALWLSPFMVSPQKDAGYDVADYCDVDPLFGTLADFDELLAAAHARGIRIIVDLVPNHSSDQHPWFQAALTAAPGSPGRARYIFREGRGPEGDQPPTNWESIFGGPAWTRVTEADGSPGQWYLHLFDTSQPDFNWDSEDVREEFRRILRFWLDRGVDGFRVDVAHGMVKDPTFPDWTPDPQAASMGGDATPAPYWEQVGVHDIYRDWNRLLAQYDGDRALCGEAWVSTIEKTALWVRPDEMHQTFNFHYLETPWDASALRRTIDDSLTAFSSVGAPSTWVLSNHDVVRHATRLGLTAESPQGAGIGPDSPGLPDRSQALQRARAATALMLALPGSAYLYQGEELGLPEVLEIPDDARQDPTWFRTSGERYGRDGCRVPIPWEAHAPAHGFSATGRSWIPQPQGWGEYARDGQRHDADSTLSMYRRLLALRRTHRLGEGSVEWLDVKDLLGAEAAEVLALRNQGVVVLANLGADPVALPAAATVLAASTHLPSAQHGVERSSVGGAAALLPSDAVVWLVSPESPEFS